MDYDVTIVGGGIVGLAVGMTLTRQRPGTKVAVLEKETSLAMHQTGNNSGVIHSGIYYKPGSFKAKFCREGAQAMVRFCREHGLAHHVCGKVIVATEEAELPRLEALYHRGLANQVPVAKITPAEAKEIEPHVHCLAAIRVFSTGIVNYRQVCNKYAELMQQQGGEIRLGTCVFSSLNTTDGLVLNTSAGEITSRFMVNCAGLFSDRIAHTAGANPRAKIIPFRGEYYELIPEKRHLVKALIYPVPNPAFPFLGVHFTKMIDGSVHAGPNAVLSLKREGYTKTDVDLRDLLDVITYPAFWKLAARHYDEGVQEIIRSFSKAAFVRSLQRLIPEVQMADVVPTHAGVRAQALYEDGNLVDDFLIVRGQRSLHVCNAPSPAATSSLEIGRAIVDQIPELT
ncbi:MAG: L-2-hydroxyglutarate oxidase [Cyanobacteria bacterium]|nr:L-2-hydroxyglutarate oxidase [Cyanobacteriota bacterium]MDW8202540.1 L-2-hydroxyglutarate oxidase [Cyanobacteriota bacterium SKYGB_h_bin112]